MIGEKVAIVTGGSSGLGYAISEELLRHNISVYMIGRDENKLQSACKKLSKRYKTYVSFITGDISNEEFVKEIFSKLENENKSIDYLFNCAGVGRFGTIEENNREKIDIAFSGSLIGLILMSSNAVKFMKQNGGTIINIMSTASLKGNANESIYCAAKWGARGFTESLKTELKGSNIKIVSVYPGGMHTDFWSKECGASPDVAKFMHPEEVAEKIVHAILDKESMYVSELILERK